MNDYNAANTKHIRDAKKAAKFAEAEREIVVLNLMSSSSGRAYVYDRLVRCHVFHTPFAGDDARTNFNTGEQNVGLELLAEVARYAPDQFIFMLREANDRAISDSRPSRSREDSGRDDNGPDSDSPADRYVDRDDSTGDTGSDE